MVAPVIGSSGTGHTTVSTGTTVTVPITATAAGQFVCITANVSVNSATVPTLSIAGASLTWNPITSFAGPATSPTWILQSWYAITTAALSAVTVTITSNITIDSATAIYLTATGQNAAQPFDQNPALANGSGSGGTVQALITGTNSLLRGFGTNTNDTLVCFCYGANSVQGWAASTGFTTTQVISASGGAASTAYQVLQTAPYTVNQPYATGSSPSNNAATRGNLVYAFAITADALTVNPQIRTGATVREWLDTATAQLRAGGTVREWLYNAPGQFESSKIARESLLFYTTQMSVGFEVRETLLRSPPTQLWFSAAVREALLYWSATVTSIRFSSALREALVAPTRFDPSALVRETLFYRSPTALNESRLVREAMWMTPGVSHFSRVAREVMLQTARVRFSYIGRETLYIVQNVLRFDLVTREVLFDPLTFGRMSTIARETLGHFPNPSSMWMSFEARETLIYQALVAQMWVSAIVREAIVANTLGWFSTEARETLIIGISFARFDFVCREAMILNPVPPPPRKTRKSYFWVNYGNT